MAPNAVWDDPAAGIALARCLAEEGRMEEAAAAADALILRTTSEDTRRYATYLSALYRDDPDAVAPGEDIWGAVSADRAAGADLQRILENRKER